MSGFAERRRGRGFAPRAGGAVRLHIDELALHGVAPAEAGRLSRALEAELFALAAQPGARLAAMTAESLPVARIVAGRAPEQTGRAAAAAVWSGVAKAGTGENSR